MFSRLNTYSILDSGSAAFMSADWFTQDTKSNNPLAPVYPIEGHLEVVVI